MRIKKLEIFGFKSFADRIVINFDTGVTGIVGPNGCGKSNVVDALRWVMGEQNAKHLRGDNMQDIIFNGSQGRGPLGMAEVVLTLENDGNLVPPEYALFSEIQVTRRLYKTGDSEYEINKRACRLRDITELFLGTGVGTKAYSIIEQGRVSSIVQAKPDERRQIIEEAAGITKYKARRNAAERKMEATEQNLVRINDVRREVQSQLSSLERQAKKAERYHELQKEIREIDVHHGVLRFLELNNRLSYLRKEEQSQQQIVNDFAASIGNNEETVEDGRLALADEEKKLSLSQGMLYEAENAVALCKQDIAFVNNNLDQKQKQSIYINEETRRLEQRSEQLSSERERYLSEGTSIEDELALLETTLQVSSAELQALAQRRADKTRLVQDTQSQFTQAASSAARAQAEIQSLNRQQENALFREKMLADEKIALKKQLAEQVERCSALKAEIGQGRENKAKFEQDLIDKKEEMQTLSDELLQIENEKRKIGEGMALKQGRLKSLQEIEQSYDWGSDGLSRIMKDKNASNIVGLVADFIEVPKELEALVEEALRHRLEAVVVRNPNDAIALAQILKQKQEGRIRFFVENECDNDQFETLAFEKGYFLSPELTVLEQQHTLIKRVLGDILIVENAQDAAALWPLAMQRRVSIVCKSGELFDIDGSIVGGAKSKSAGVLGRKREIREIDAELKKLAQARENLEIRYQQCLDQKTGLARRIEEMRVGLQNLTLSLVRFEENLSAKESECNRLQTKEKELDQESVQIAATLARAKNELDALQASWAASLESHRLLEEDLSGHRDILETLEGEVASKSEEVTTLRIRAASSKERQTNLVRAAEQSLKNLGDVHSQMNNLANQLVQLTEDQAQLAVQREVAEQKMSESQREKEILTKNIEEQRARYEARLAEVKQKEASLSVERKELDRLKTALNEFVLKIQECTLAMKALSERLYERYRTKPHELVFDYHHLPMLDFNVEKKLSDLQKSIEQLGTINPNAINEYQELSERFNFLKAQSDDLATALEQLQSAIGKINATTKQRFEEAFHAINERFSVVFPRLFRGGKAWLEMTNPSDLLTSGVEIYAQPPGKKLGSIALMSGGEKALTATSLIFAIFLIKPSPFCLLDEVDAPLDEANVDRFSNMVKEMSKISQFILITHNKRTMEVADQLYGVTMEQPGISKTVNVRVTQADGARNGDKKLPDNPSLQLAE